MKTLAIIGIIGSLVVSDPNWYDKSFLPNFTYPRADNGLSDTSKAKENASTASNIAFEAFCGRVFSSHTLTSDDVQRLITSEAIRQTMISSVEEISTSAAYKLSPKDILVEIERNLRKCIEITHQKEYDAIWLSWQKAKNAKVKRESVELSRANAKIDSLEKQLEKLREEYKEYQKKYSLKNSR